jgi:hypothetical protein
MERPFNRLASTGRILKGEKPADLPSAISTVNQSRADYQCAHCEIAWPDHFSSASWPRRRGHQISRHFAAVHFVRLWPEADFSTPSINVRFRVNKRHFEMSDRCLLYPSKRRKLRLRQAAYVHYRLMLECPIIKVAKRGTIRKSIGHDPRLSVVMAGAAFDARPR